MHQNLSCTSPLRFKHIGQACLIGDLRDQPSADIKLSQVYYTSFRLQNRRTAEEFYRHVLMLADNIERFMFWAALEGASTPVIPGIAESDICGYRMVFMRNMETLTPGLANLSHYQDISAEIHTELSHGNEESCLIFGLVGDNDVSLVHAYGKDACSAIEVAEKTTKKQLHQPFKALEACYSHEALLDCYALFEVAAARIQKLNDFVPDAEGYAH